MHLYSRNGIMKWKEMCILARLILFSNQMKPARSGEGTKACRRQSRKQARRSVGNRKERQNAATMRVSRNAATMRVLCVGSPSYLSVLLAQTYLRLV